nr:hypothetical protein [Tanacetum cinerariifolium]
MVFGIQKSASGNDIFEVESATSTLPEIVVTQEIEDINTTLADTPKEAEPVVVAPEATMEEPKDETTTVNAPPPLIEDTITEKEVQTTKVSEEPKEETPVTKEAHMT